MTVVLLINLEVGQEDLLTHVDLPGVTCEHVRNHHFVDEIGLSSHHGKSKGGNVIHSEDREQYRDGATKVRPHSIIVADRVQVGVVSVEVSLNRYTEHVDVLEEGKGLVTLPYWFQVLIKFHI